MAITVFPTSTQQRITADEALDLFLHADLLELGLRAEAVKARYHQATDPFTFVIDRNVNYTNICNVDCMFCAFYRHKEDEDAYVLNYPEHIKPKIQELVDANGTQLLLQGGVNPDLPFEYYTDVIREIRRDYPDLTIHAFSPTELEYIVEMTGWSIHTVLQKLIDAGLSSIPGGGAEILSDRPRHKVSPKKTGAQAWLDIMQAAHELGLRTSATMMFGMVERPEEIVEHLFRLRELQDKTAGFTAFIPWTFQPENTQLQKLPHLATGVDYLRVLALSRIVLDNFINIQSSWLTQGTKLCQTGLFFGANDAGGLVMEENVVTLAGVKEFNQPLESMLKLIHTTGRDAAQRDTHFNIIQHYPRPA